MIGNMMADFNQFISNPEQYAMSHWGITKDMANNPSAIINKMMGEGRITQAQYNQAHAMARQMKNSPMFSRFFK